MNNFKSVEKVGGGLQRFGLKPLTVTATRSMKSDASSMIRLNSTTPAIVLTIDKPVIGHLLVITQIDSGTAGHTVELTTGTYDGTNNTLTFNALGETVVLLGVTATRYVIVENIGSVGLG